MDILHRNLHPKYCNFLIRFHNMKDFLLWKKYLSIVFGLTWVWISLIIESTNSIQIQGTDTWFFRFTWTFTFTFYLLKIVTLSLDLHNLKKNLFWNYCSNDPSYNHAGCNKHAGWKNLLNLSNFEYQKCLKPV